MDSDGQHLIENVIEMDKALKGSGGGVKAYSWESGFWKGRYTVQEPFWK